MDIEKPLQETGYEQELIEGHFFLSNLLTRLVIYPDTMHLENQRMECTYLITFNFSYDIYRHNNGWILLVNCPEPIKFFSLMDLEDWDNVLIKIMRRQRFHEFFKGVKKIGKGNFATVYLSQRVVDNKCFAVKAFQKQSTFKSVNGKQGLENQINILRKLNHPNITHLEGVFETENSIYLVMDYINGKSLGDILDQQKMLALPLRKKIIKGILSALAEMENKNIVHRDIKPENIMIDADDEAKIVDFGLATDINVSNYLYVRCGTPGFVAPQIISIRDTENARMSTISDVFSAGAILYQMIFGKALFEGEKNNQVLEKNRKCNISIPISSDVVIFQELVLLRRMLDISPETRIPASQALKSNYFTDAKEAKQPLQEIALQTFAQKLPLVKNNPTIRPRKVKRIQNKEN